MIHIQAKRFQVVLWRDEQRLASDVALRMDLDTLEEAAAIFEAQRAAGVYRSGILMEWHKQSSIWNLLDQFPDRPA